jgi:Ca2+-binding RTX toxin-like protein
MLFRFRSRRRRVGKGRLGLAACAVLALLLGILSAPARADTFTFSNTGTIAVPASGTFGSAAPYPSQISVSGLTGTITQVTVELQTINHTFPDDIDVLLVGPFGQNVLLWSDAGGGTDLVNVFLGFDDTAAASLPDSTAISTGSYKPTNYGTPESFGSPAPSGPYGSALSIFNGTDPNGTWSLYVTDDNVSNTGSIADGWLLNIDGPTVPAGAPPPPGVIPGPAPAAGQTPAPAPGAQAGACANPKVGTNASETLNGTSAGDFLLGRRGNDTLNGFSGDDCLRGEGGNDVLSGGSGFDSLEGGSGNDRLTGGRGNDRLVGGIGGDRLTGGAGRNSYSGGSGNDVVNAANGRTETVSCGRGRRDRAVVDDSDRVRGCESVSRR